MEFLNQNIRISLPEIFTKIVSTYFFKMYLMFSDGAAEKSAAFFYDDCPAGIHPGGLVINKRTGRRYR
jgi:hypothetical protein